jgi:biopolymer transport protein ExbB/TolQ
MDSVLELLKLINSLSPVAIIGLLGTVIFMLVRGKTAVDEKADKIATNHLHGLPEMASTLEDIKDILRTMSNQLQRIELRLGEDLTYLKTKLNGSAK